MIGICKNSRQRWIRLCAAYSLIFFVAWLPVACRQPENDHLTIRWTGKRATGIAIPHRLVQRVTPDSLPQWLAVRLAGSQTAILGHYQRLGDDIIFEPLIPFTRGLRYAMWWRNRPLGELTIPGLAPNDQPTLLAIYPSQDSLPDNLLKVYLQFSRPMREGQSQRYVALLKNKADTLPGVFLDLQPELWNTDRTRLTLWLDPGRIKRDLQPNKRLGVPLQPGIRYQLVVSAGWPDEQGALLGKATTKPFLTVPRDSLSPAPARWAIDPPPSGSRLPLTVAFGEALDYGLLTQTLHVVREDGKTVPGTWQLGDEEKWGWFKPEGAWAAGGYRLRIEGRLEDLAGNNLNRPFDRDVTRPDHPQPSQPVVELTFNVTVQLPHP